MNPRTHNAGFTNAARGFTLLEMMLALVIVGVILVVGIVMFARALNEANTRKMESGLDQVFAATRTLYPTQNYMTVSGQILARSGHITPELVDGANNLVAPWGAIIKVQPSALTGPLGSSFDVVLQNAPRYQCADLVIHAKDEALRIAVGTTVLKDQSASPPIAAPNVIQAVNACAASASSDISFTST